jgi:hypothetical protein
MLATTPSGYARHELLRRRSAESPWMGWGMERKLGWLNGSPAAQRASSVGLPFSSFYQLSPIHVCLLSRVCDRKSAPSLMGVICDTQRNGFGGASGGIEGGGAAPAGRCAAP